MFSQRLFLNHHGFVLFPPWSFFLTCRQQPKLFPFYPSPLPPPLPSHTPAVLGHSFMCLHFLLSHSLRHMDTLILSCISTVAFLKHFSYKPAHPSAPFPTFFPTSVPFRRTFFQFSPHLIWSIPLYVHPWLTFYLSALSLQQSFHFSSPSFSVQIMGERCRVTPRPLSLSLLYPLPFPFLWLSHSSLSVFPSLRACMGGGANYTHGIHVTCSHGDCTVAL